MPLTIEVPPALLAVLQRRADTRRRTVEEEAAAVLAGDAPPVTPAEADPSPASFVPVDAATWEEDPELAAAIEKARRAPSSPRRMPTADLGDVLDELMKNDPPDFDVEARDREWATFERELDEADRADAERDAVLEAELDAARGRG